MEGRLLVKDCTLLDRGALHLHRAVVVQGGMVARISPDADEPVRPGDWAIEAGGRLLVPGRVDGHACPGHVPGARRALTEPESSAVAAAAIALALRIGVTTMLEQVEGVEDGGAALDGRFRVARALGVRLVASLAAEGRHGIATHELNAEAARRTADDPLVRAGLGFASCLTASDELLRAVVRDAEALRASVQFRLAETSAELAEHFEQHRIRMVERLDRNLSRLADVIEVLDEAYPPESYVAGKTAARPEIWQHFDDFQERLKKLASASAAFAEATWWAATVSE